MPVGMAPDGLRLYHEGTRWCKAGHRAPLSEFSPNGPGRLKSLCKVHWNENKRAKHKPVSRPHVPKPRDPVAQGQAVLDLMTRVVLLCDSQYEAERMMGMARDTFKRKYRSKRMSFTEIDHALVFLGEPWRLDEFFGEIPIQDKAPPAPSPRFTFSASAQRRRTASANALGEDKGSD